VQAAACVSGAASALAKKSRKRIGCVYGGAPLRGSAVKYLAKAAAANRALCGAASCA